MHPRQGKIYCTVLEYHVVKCTEKKAFSSGIGKPSITTDGFSVLPFFDVDDIIGVDLDYLVENTLFGALNSNFYL